MIQPNYLPCFILAALGVLAIVGGFASGGPDRSGGLIFGGMAFVAAGVIAHRKQRMANASAGRDTMPPTTKG